MLWGLGFGNLAERLASPRPPGGSIESLLYFRIANWGSTFEILPVVSSNVAVIVLSRSKYGLEVLGLGHCATRCAAFASICALLGFRVEGRLPLLLLLLGLRCNSQHCCNTLQYRPKDLVKTAVLIHL